MGADPAEEEQFGPYLVYERLGVGGMATVHRALERGVEGFERIVALKRLLPHLAEDASFIKSFVREAKLASILNHVNIVQIYELGRVGIQYFISMEYIDGRDVRRILRHARKVTGPPPIHITVGLMAQLCEALDYAHHKVDEEGHPLGLVHRDVSPSNLLITSSGHLKVIDFGIAKAQSSQLRTQTGRVKGKLAYMAPEAIAGKDLDARSDLWAAGVILHELLTARPLFASKNEYQTLLKVQRGDIMPPSTFNQACPPELDAIVFKALARDPDDRFSNASEFREELLALRRQYQLNTGYRDVSAWLDWAFSLEQPAGFAGNTLDNTGSVVEPSAIRHKTPRPPRNKEEDEAVEMVWGSHEGSEHEGPVLLDDIPDVSHKHRSAAYAAQPDPDEIDDDIPTPAPTHGSRSRELPAVRGTNPDVDVKTPVPRGSDPGVIAKVRGSDQLAAQQRPATQPAATRSKSTTAPGVAAARSSEKMPAQRPSRPSVPMPAQKPVARDGSNPPSTRAPTVPPPRKRAESSQHTDPDGKALENTTNPTARPVSDTPRAAHALEADGLFGTNDEPADTLVGMKAAPAMSSSELDEIATLPPMQPRKSSTAPEPTTNPDAVPIDAPPIPQVRFAKSPSTPPANVPLDPLAPTQTKPGMTPVSLRAPSSPSLDTDEPVTVYRKKRDSNLVIGSAIASRANKPRRGLWIVLGLVIAGALATAATLYVTRGDDSVTPISEPTPRAPVHVLLSVKFITEPVDAEIKIEGVGNHTGSPWSVELEPGVHQIEIHRSGYKSWLTSLELSASDGNQTLRVALEPLGNSVATTEATLAVTTTPAGLDVVLDGEVLAQRTPIKLTIKAGPHTIAVRQNGVEVWHQNVNAEAAANYEYNPSFTEEKKRERSERLERPSRTPRPTGDLSRDALAKATKDPTKDLTAPRADEPTPDAKPAEIKPEPRIDTKPAEPKPELKPDPKPEHTTPKPEVLPPKPEPQITAEPTPPPAVHVAPQTVPPSAVTKLSGAAPSIGKTKNAEIPAIVPVKVCIDATGKVNGVEPMSNKLDRIAKQDIIDGLTSWRYTPYKKANVAVPACFIVTLRTK